jgi:hypothetical protein
MSEFLASVSATGRPLTLSSSGNDDLVDRCCCVRLSHCNLGGSDDSRTDSSAGQRDCEVSRDRLGDRAVVGAR